MFFSMQKHCEYTKRMRYDWLVVTSFYSFLISLVSILKQTTLLLHNDTINYAKLPCETFENIPLRKPQSMQLVRKDIKPTRRTRNDGKQQTIKQVAQTKRKNGTRDARHPN